MYLITTEKIIKILGTVFKILNEMKKKGMSKIIKHKKKQYKITKSRTKQKKISQQMHNKCPTIIEKKNYLKNERFHLALNTNLYIH